MQNKRISLLFALTVTAALAFTGCATGPTVEIMMDPDAPVTEAPPVYAVGSSFTFDHTVNGETQRHTTIIVEKQELDGRQVDVHALSPPNRDPGTPCDGANGNMHDAVTHNWMGCLKDGEILASTTPHNGYYEWPLEVGRSWRSDYTWTDNVIHPDWSGPSWEEWTVVAWEEVTVPAGTFMAYKVVRTKTNWETESEDMSTLWYAPEFGGGVKGITVRSDMDGYGAAELMWELVSKDPKYPSES